jgi:hypothetical protein
MKWLGFLRGRSRYTPPIGPNTAADDWQVGDLAEAIGSVGWYEHYDGQPSDGPPVDRLLRVRDVDMADGWQILAFHGLLDWYVAHGFRKVRPQPPNACSTHFAGKLAGMRPKVGA